jgi:hypothetical protein
MSALLTNKDCISPQNSKNPAAKILSRSILKVITSMIALVYTISMIKKTTQSTSTLNWNLQILTSGSLASINPT